MNTITAFWNYFNQNNFVFLLLNEIPKEELKTHITTSLSATEIEKHYGNRVRSRLREMVNLIAYDKSTPDKR